MVQDAMLVTINHQ